MKLLSFFSGIGAFEKALDNLNIPYDLVAYCEINKYASKSYSAIHGVPETMNLGDITKVDEKALQKDIDLVTYGFPCQDISLAGKLKGLFNEDGTQTRSGLFFEALRIIEETQPKVAIAENVKNLTSKKFAKQFGIVLEALEQAGYNNYWKVLVATDFGIPQRRERVFIVSVRKDIDTGCFRFPKGFPLELRLKDLLEDEVDGKYYLGEKGLNLVKRHQSTRRDRTTKDADLTLIQLAHGFNPGSEMDADVFPTLTIGSAMHWHTLLCEKQKKVYVREATKKGYAEAVEGDSINLEQPNSKTRRGRVGHGVAQTLTTSPHQVVVKVEQEELIVRRLTPKECFRLQGFDDESFHRAEAVNSDTQLYRQAGNSICVPVVQHIISALVDAGVFGGKAKQLEYTLEGQMSFADPQSFDRYIEAYRKEEISCGN